MAIDKSIHCRFCQKTKTVTCAINSCPTVCDECSAKAANKERRMWLNKFASLPTKTAIRLLAEEVWELKHSPSDSGDRLIG